SRGVKRANRDLCAAKLSGGVSRAKDIPGQKQSVGGTLGDPSHQIGIPLGSKRYVDSHRISPRSERALQIAANSIKHLKLESAPVNPAVFGKVLQRFDDRPIVGGEGGVAAALDQL